MNKYAIYTDGLTYPVLEKDGQYYIGVPGTGHFSGQWKFLGVRERLKNSRTIIKPEDALKITDWKFKNGSPRYQVVDLDHGSVRTWAGTSADQQLKSFDTISDSGFNIATKTDKDEEITLEESKKYAIYATYGGDGVYNSKLVDTVDSEEQAVDRVAELQATGVGASYEEIETKKEVLNDSKLKKILTDYFKDDYIIEEKDGKIYTYQKGSNRKIFDIYNNWKELLDTTDLDVQNLEEECSQVSGVASGVNGKIDSFPINPKEMEKQRLKESTETQMIITVESGLNADGFDITIKEGDKEVFNKSYRYGYDASYSKEHADSARHDYEQAIKYNWEDADLYYNLKPYTQDIIEDLMKKYHITKNNIIVTNGKNVFKGEPVSDDNVNKFINKYIEPIKESKSINETLKESIDNSLIQKDFERMNKMKDMDSIKDYLYEITMNQNYNEARNTLISYLKQAILDKNENIINATKYIIDTSFGGLQGLEDFFTLTEAKEDDIFNAREELINYLNQNTKYEWDANESYDNCAITESETDYIEVFVDIKDGNKIYTVDNYSYNSLEELIKNMPVLFTDEDEDYDYDSNWEDLDESKDLTKTLHEMALLEDYEDDISPQKKKFIEFCKDKIKDLGDIEIYDETVEENVQYHKIMHTEGIREFNDLYIVANFEEYDENLKAINSENKMVIDTPMIDCNGYAATMQFDEIDQEYYHTLLEYWNDLYMDEMIDDEEE